MKFVDFEERSKLNYTKVYLINRSREKWLLHLKLIFF